MAEKHIVQNRVGVMRLASRHEKIFELCPLLPILHDTDLELKQTSPQRTLLKDSNSCVHKIHYFFLKIIKKMGGRLYEHIHK